MKTFQARKNSEGTIKTYRLSDFCLTNSDGSYIVGRKISLDLIAFSRTVFAVHDILTPEGVRRDRDRGV